MLDQSKSNRVAKNQAAKGSQALRGVPGGQVAKSASSVSSLGSAKISISSL